MQNERDAGHGHHEAVRPPLHSPMRTKHHVPSTHYIRRQFVHQETMVARPFTATAGGEWRSEPTHYRPLCEPSFGMARACLDKAMFFEFLKAVLKATENLITAAKCKSWL